MTNEEVMRNVKTAFEWWEDNARMEEDEDWSRQHESLDIAIKALDQQPCEDCISREAVIRLVEQYPNIIGNKCSGLIADIKHLPSVTPKAECKRAYSEGYNEGYEDAKELYS